ncbi:MAG: hypothetical protein HQK89_14775 [Nitrospirae bacterium]|nr:hypothetical protein [Nitrospirota bacterium]
MTNILIIRSCSFQHLDRVIERLKGDFPEAKFAVLTHVHGKEMAATYTNVSRVIVYPYVKSFSFTRLPQELRYADFDVVIVPVSNVSGAGFLNVFLFSLRIRSIKRYIINIRLELKPFSATKATGMVAADLVYKIVAVALTPIMSGVVLLTWIGYKLTSMSIDKVAGRLAGKITGKFTGRKR